MKWSEKYSPMLTTVVGVAVFSETRKSRVITENIVISNPVPQKAVKTPITGLVRNEKSSTSDKSS